MTEMLNRNEVPLQPVFERGQDIDVVVPVHLGVLALDAAVKESLDLAQARQTVIDTYNADIDAYLMYMSEQGYDDIIGQLRDYWEFNPDWVLDAEPSDSGTGFLKLSFQDGDQVHTLQHDEIPVPYQNRHDEDGNFYLPEVFEQRRIFPIVYRGITDPVFLFMPPEKLLHYGVEVPELNGIIVDPVGGIAEVVGTSFDSAYQSNLAIALLLRNFGVAYMNQLAVNVEVNGVE